PANPSTLCSPMKKSLPLIMGLLLAFWTAGFAQPPHSTSTDSHRQPPAAEVELKLYQVWHKLAVGMTRKEVVAITGEPPSGKDPDLMEWKFRAGATKEAFRLRFKDGRLAETNLEGVRWSTGPYGPDIAWDK